MTASTYNNHRRASVEARAVGIVRIIGVIRIPWAGCIVRPRIVILRGEEGRRFEEIIDDFLAYLGLVQASKRWLVQGINRTDGVKIMCNKLRRHIFAG